jgi:DNA-binding transcriptional ArsR family regulator
MKHRYTDPFQAIADPNRRQILHLLSKDHLSINSLAENFDMSRPAVSKHIKILYSAGFIIIEDRGRERYCGLRQEGFRELQSWIDFFDKFWNSKLDALGSFLLKTDTSSNKRKISKKINHE